MTGSPNIATLAAPLADPVRARMVCLMMDGRARTVAELGASAGLAKASASEQISTLVDAGFLRAERRGRHKYLALAGPEIAHLVETMMVLAGQSPASGPGRSRALGARIPPSGKRGCATTISPDPLVSGFTKVSRPAGVLPMPRAA